MFQTKHICRLRWAFRLPCHFFLLSLQPPSRTEHGVSWFWKAHISCLPRAAPQFIICFFRKCKTEIKEEKCSIGLVATYTKRFPWQTLFFMTHLWKLHDVKLNLGGVLRVIIIVAWGKWKSFISGQCDGQGHRLSLAPHSWGGCRPYVSLQWICTSPISGLHFRNAGRFWKRKGLPHRWWD